jgi:hypothetical protein
VTPGSQAGAPPSDAKVLFNGTDASAFEGIRGEPVKWEVRDGTLIVAPHTGSIRTRGSFGDCQIHVEWTSPNPPTGEGQSRGNSGIIVMGMFEIQVLDSYHSKTYSDGQAGALYGQYPPLVNATKAPGEWQTYDIVFRKPRFDANGGLVSRARVTVFHNGVVVQDNSLLGGPTANHNRPPFFPIPDRLPLVLQEHGTAVRYRNIWIRDLAPEREAVPLNWFIPVKPNARHWAEYVGEYRSATDTLTVTQAESGLHVELRDQEGVTAPFELAQRGDDAFFGRGLPGNDVLPLVFTREDGKVKTVTVFLRAHYVSFARQ